MCCLGCALTLRCTWGAHWREKPCRETTNCMSWKFRRPSHVLSNVNTGLTTPRLFNWEGTIKVSDYHNLGWSWTLPRPERSVHGMLAWHATWNQLWAHAKLHLQSLDFKKSIKWMVIWGGCLCLVRGMFVCFPVWFLGFCACEPSEEM